MSRAGNGNGTGKRGGTSHNGTNTTPPARSRESASQGDGVRFFNDGKEMDPENPLFMLKTRVKILAKDPNVNIQHNTRYGQQSLSPDSAEEAKGASTTSAKKSPQSKWDRPPTYPVHQLKKSPLGKEAREKESSRLKVPFSAEDLGRETQKFWHYTNKEREGFIERQKELFYTPPEAPQPFLPPVPSAVSTAASAAAGVSLAGMGKKQDRLTLPSVNAPRQSKTGSPNASRYSSDHNGHGNHSQRPGLSPESNGGGRGGSR